VPTSEGTVHVHCASRGLPRRPIRPIYEPERVTVQLFQWGYACYQLATLGVVEATVESDEEKNRLCPPITYWDADTDYLSAFLAILANQRTRESAPALASWAMASRLNPFSALAQSITTIRSSSTLAGASNAARPPRRTISRRCLPTRAKKKARFSGLQWRIGTSRGSSSSGAPAKVGLPDCFGVSSAIFRYGTRPRLLYLEARREPAFPQVATTPPGLGTISSSQRTGDIANEYNRSSRLDSSAGHG
jgi:hypothetical protein